MERFLSNLRVRLEEHISPNMMRVIRPFYDGAICYIYAFGHCEHCRIGRHSHIT